MQPLDPISLRQTRRSFLGNSTRGIGSLALASLINPQLLSAMTTAPATQPAAHARGVVYPLHIPARAKRVIHLYMAGGPTHLDTFDFKPRLREMTGKPMPDSFTKGQPIAQLQGKELRCLGAQYDFKTFGKSGQNISELFPHIGSIADDICIINSMQTDAINHDPAHTFMNTGTLIAGRPSMGSWVWYGLDAEADNLPGFVVLTSAGNSGRMRPIATRQWHSGFLARTYNGEPVHPTPCPDVHEHLPAHPVPAEHGIVGLVRARRGGG